MKKLWTIFWVLSILLMALCACAAAESGVEETTSAELQEVVNEPIEVITNHQKFFIDDYNNESWDNNEDMVDAVKNIFLLKERYYSHEFNYAVLTEALSDYMDLPQTFIKPDGAYGFIDPTDVLSIVTNEDTAKLGEDEFNELLARLTFYVRPYDISEYYGSDAVSRKVDSIKSANRRYYMSPIIEEDENSTIIYVKERNTYDVTDEKTLDFDTGITDYWFLFKKDIGKVYSHRNWSTAAKADELELNKIIMREQEIDIELFDISDSIFDSFD